MTERRKGPHIIVMEDEPVIRGLIAYTLCRRGYEVEEASNGEQALALLDQRLRIVPGSPVLMILDLAIPDGMGGAQTLERARVMAPDVKAIIATGLSDEDELSRLKEPGLTDVLPKPYDMRSLQESVEALAGVKEPAG